MATKWKVYYSNGTTMEGEGRGSPIGRGVQAIVQDHPEVGVEIVTSSDYYVWKNGRWFGVDIFGLFDYLLDTNIVGMGTTIKREEYQKIMKEAMKEKAGWLPRERKSD